MIGQKFGRWTVLALAPRKKKYDILWKCRCECGKEKDIKQGHLRSGASQSCGCLSSEVTAARNFKHGQTKTSTYKTWQSMKERCQNPNNHAYMNYGGRGVTVCPEWQYFENFLADMGERPMFMEIDRIDNNKGYSRDNCRWVTATQNQRNKRHSLYLTYKGITRHLKEWAEMYEISYYTLRARVVRRGWDIERAITEPAFIGKNQMYPWMQEVEG